MKTLKTLTVLAALLAILCAVPVSGDSGEWEWQNPLPQGNDLNGVWGSSGSDVFAVGKSGTILHYDGSS